MPSGASKHRDGIGEGGGNALEAARAAVRGVSCWIISDGKPGDESQCLGVAERLGLTAEVRRVNPRPPFVWLMPWGGIDIREGRSQPRSPLAGAFPDIAIASGRRTVPYLRKIRALSSGRTFTVYLKDPRIGAKTADFIWVPQHDRLRGSNVLATLTSPHRIAPERLRDAAERPPHGLKQSKKPRIAILIGGDSDHHRFTPDDRANFAHGLREIAGTGAFLMATASRRTPPALLSETRAIVQAADGFFWNGAGENPLLAMLGLANAIVVTADSVNMVGEAVTTGKPVYVFTPTGGSPRINSFLAGLAEAGAIRPFSDRIEPYIYAPIDATPVIAVELARRFAAHRASMQDKS